MLVSELCLFVTPQTVMHQASLSTEFSRQECWSGLPFPSPGDLPNPGIKPESPALQADTLPSEPPGKPQSHYMQNKIHDSYCHFPFPFLIPSFPSFLLLFLPLPSLPHPFCGNRTVLVSVGSTSTKFYLRTFGGSFYFSPWN